MSAKGFWATQDGHICQVIAPVSAGAAVVGTRFNLAEWDHASLILHFGAAGGAIGAITLKAYAAETGDSGVAIPYRLVKFENTGAPYDLATLNSATNNTVFYEAATGYTPSADEANAMYVLEIEAADVLAAANGTYLELNIAIGNLGSTAQLLSALAVLSAGRVTGDLTASAQV